MKKRIIIAGFLLALTGFGIWSCKKATDPTPAAQNPASPVRTSGSRMTVAQADEAGYYHNLGLSNADIPLGYNVDPDDMNEALVTFLDENDLDVPSTVDAETWFAEAEAASNDEEFSPDNFANTLYTNGMVDGNGKDYIDLVVDKLEDIIAVIDTADHGCDPGDRPDSTFYNYVDSIQAVVIDDTQIDNDQNDRIQVMLSVIKYSGLYWFACDEYGNRGANRLIAARGPFLSTACKNCLKKQWGWIILADGLGAGWGYLVSQNIVSALIKAISWSGWALRRVCPMCL